MMLMLKELKKHPLVREVLALNSHLFQYLLVTLLLLLLIEEVWHGNVSHFLNINHLLLIVVVSGVLAILGPKGKAKREPVGSKDYFIAAVAGLAGAAIIWYKTQALGMSAAVISVAAGLLIALLSMLVLEENSKGLKLKKEKR